MKGPPLPPPRVAAGDLYNCGLTVAGTVYCRGRNGDGELGDGITTPRLNPVPVAGALSFSVMTAGAQSHGLLIADPDLL